MSTELEREGERLLDAAASDTAVALDTRSALGLAEEQVRVSVGQMREANERLVLSALKAEGLAEEASEARAAAEGARRKLEETEMALREANQRKDEFLAMLGHELRNPLAPILTAIELMKQRASGPSIREREVIERQVRHMVRLIDDLLDVSRITSGKVVIDRAPMEISTAILKAVETASPLLETQRHSFSVSAPETGLMVSGDATRLSQVIANLLTNAAKYTEPGGVISLTARREGDWVRIGVKDNGSGISPALLPHLFERFVQGEQTIERSRGGLGLGLSIVRSLIELHGGRVTAESEGIGQGSEFVVCLPALDGVSLEVDQARTQRRYARSARRVLVVDDNVDAAEMLGAALSASDREVAIAHDGPEALRMVASFEPDAVVIDIGLPVMDGYEVARKVRASERPGAPPIRLIALTGYGQESDRQRSAGAGMDVHLVKPVDLEELEAALADEPLSGADTLALPPS